MVSPYQVFERAERVERLSAEIYRALGVRFAHEPEARCLFARLEAEELQHARRVRLLAARYRHDSRLLERPSASIRELELLAAESEAILAAIEEGKWAQDLATVLSSLAALEDRTASAHAHLIAIEGNPELRAFFEQLALQDEAHHALLREALPGAAR